MESRRNLKSIYKACAYRGTIDSKVKLKENDLKEWVIDEILLHNPCGYNINGFL